MTATVPLIPASFRARAMGSRRVVGEVVFGPQRVERDPEAPSDSDTDLMPTAAKGHADGRCRIAQLDRETGKGRAALADGRFQVFGVSVLKA